MNKIYGTSLLAITLLLGGCKEETQKVALPTAVSIIKVVQTDLPIYKEYVGTIYGYKDIPIRARVEGFLETIDFEEGTRVNEGQLLYTIDSQPFAADVAAAKSKVAEAETKLVNAENELARYKPLADSKAVSQSDVDAAQATRDAAEASLHAAEANLEMSEINLSYATMRSPINGIIGKTSARVGEYVGKDPNPVILNTVSRLDTVRVQFFLPEAQYLSVVRSYIEEKKMEPAERDENYERTPVSLTLSDGNIYEHNGHVDFLDRNIEESTGAILIQASFPNPDRILRPGSYAKVRLQFSTEINTIVIPQRCVNETQGTYSVMVLSDSGTVQSRQIDVGEKVKDSWQVTSGLKKGEQIVFEGLQKVHSGSKVAPTVEAYSFELE